MSKLALGTAQFGMDYGINNKRGRIPREEALCILDTAAKAGIDTLDTARSYGESEKVIGDFIKSGKRDFKIISKLPACARADVGRMFEESLKSLGVSAIYGYLMHSFENYIKDEGVWGELERLKSQGKVKKIGFSMYSPSELEHIFKKGLAVDIIQLPFSVFDQRFGPYLPEIKKKRIEVHARSIFLQGLVFKNPEVLDRYFAGVRDNILALNSLAAGLGVSTALLCVNFAAGDRSVDKIVVGVDGLDNLIEIIEAAQAVPLTKGAADEISKLRIDDENILLPFNWKLSKVAA